MIAHIYSLCFLAAESLSRIPRAVRQNAQIAWPAFERDIKKTAAALFYIQCEGSVVRKPRGVRRPNCGAPKVHASLFFICRQQIFAAASCRCCLSAPVLWPCLRPRFCLAAPVLGPILFLSAQCCECATRRPPDSSANGRTSCQPLVIIPAPYYYDLAQLSATASVINSFLMMSFHYVRGKSFLPVPCLDAVVSFYLTGVFSSHSLSFCELR